MKRAFIVLFMLCMMLTGCDGRQKKETIDFTKDNIMEIDIEDLDENEFIYISFADSTIEIEGQTYTLDEEKKQELMEYMYDYSRAVVDGKEKYWPDTDEYPDMKILFRYNIYYGTEDDFDVVKMDGANCYPDDWNETIRKLKSEYK